MKRILMLPLIIVALYIFSGCSVYMAAKQPEKKNMTVLSEGTPRGHVIAELGSPIHSEQTSDGKMDIYKFVQGYSKGAKAGRALFHGVADVATLGLWEVIGTPVEGIADGTEVTVEVHYDKDDRVSTVKSLSGESEVEPIAKKTQE